MTKKDALHKLIKLIPCFILLSVFLCTEQVQAAERLQKTGDPIIVVIDPGHGGENNGTTENGFLEKDMTMKTAKAMYDKLTQFENIEVYLTHWDDNDLSLKERAVIASQKNADFLISLHYNASDSHELFGAEVWISLFPEFHNPGYQLGTCFLREFRDMGLDLRGIKTRPHSKGKDYYGVIREAATLGIPAIIVEHCHVDHPRDCGHCDSDEELKAFGEADALAVAKYFGLKSESLGLDFTGYDLPVVTEGETVRRAMYDQTDPELCKIDLKEVSYEECHLTLTLMARDEDSNLVSYAYSLDNGLSYSQRIPLPAGDILTGEFPESYEIALAIPEGNYPSILLKVFNPYDLWRESNAIFFEKPFLIPEIQEEESMAEPVFEDATANVLPTDAANEKETYFAESILEYLKLALIIIGAGFLISFLGFLVMRGRNKRS